ncbi:MAG: aminotransferase class V-fold PLP-dependent enzyme [Candidatus Dojkabacteria bacterium]|nr:aminotransferase class V-fold PLP-dependent enzyme [Candidatus Dojkabacteria bacterium]
MKEFFPIFNNNSNLIYFDNASTTQKPSVLLDALKEVYYVHYSNVHRGMYELSEKITEMYELARQKVAKFINAKPTEIIFTSGTTEAINLVANSLKLSGVLSKSSKILLTEMEHHANIIPWQNISKNIFYLKIDDNFHVDFSSISNSIKFDLVSISLVSNVLGTYVNIGDIHKFKNSKTFLMVDAAQFAPHSMIDVKKMQVDALVFSAHKMFGPTGLGILFLKEQWGKTLLPSKVGGGIVRTVNKYKSEFVDTPWRFEAGTPPIASAITFARIIDFIESNHLLSRRLDLRNYLLTQLQNISELRIFHDVSIDAFPIISFMHPNIHAHDIAWFLGKNNICVRAGHHCAQILHRDVLKVPATVRVSFSVYNNQNEVDKFIDVLKKCIVLYSK